MKLSAVALSLFLFVGSTNAQYFSGWSSGQKSSSDNPPANPVVSSSSQTAAAAEMTPSTSASNSFLELLFTSGPVTALLSSFGVNVSAALNVKLWDERIQLITDENYQDVIVNEPLTPKEEKERAWAIIITGQALKQDEVSRVADSFFDSAYEQTQQAGDLPYIKWGRIDYLNVTRLTTKWAIWQVPYIVILTDRGQTLRFYRHYQVRLSAENLREFLKTKGYLLTPPWSTEYAPGGEKEYILDYCATIFTKVYSITNVFPRWLLVIVSGSVASFLVRLLHKSSSNASKVPKAESSPKSTIVTSDEKKPSTSAPAPEPVTETTNTLSNGTATTSTSKLQTDSERESSAKPTKRTSTRPKKSKKT